MFKLSPVRVAAETGRSYGGGRFRVVPVCLKIASSEAGRDLAPL